MLTMEKKFSCFQNNRHNLGEESYVTIIRIFVIAILAVRPAALRLRHKRRRNPGPTASSRLSLKHPLTGRTKNRRKPVFKEQTGHAAEVDPATVQRRLPSRPALTVYPLAERMADRFRQEGFAGNITIDSIGSGAGFERFCVAGETDIANACRAIKDSEDRELRGHRPHAHRVPRRHRCPGDRRQQ